MIAEEERLPRRDWLILPVLSLLSLAILLGASELLACVIWPEQLQDRCAVPDPALGLHFRSNCRSEIKGAETPLVENVYNACGFRSAGQCGSKSPNEFRVAVIGASIGGGYLVPYDQTFIAIAQEALAKRCRVPVDFQNLTVPGIGPQKAALQLPTALTLQPDVVLMALSAYDLQILNEDQSRATEASPAPGVPGGINEVVLRVAAALRASRATLVAQHFLYENLDSYLPLYLKHGDEADFLRPPLSEAWQHRLELFEREVDEIGARSRASGAHFVLVFVPLRAQALLLNWKHLPPDVDPTLLGRALSAIARRHGITYLDMTQTMGDRADVANLFYPVNAHPNAAGSAVIAGALEDVLLADDNPPGICRDQNRASK
jgi:hypothetical protein